MVTLINLLGMAIGFAIFLSFWTWVSFNLNFDRFHEDIDRMYMLHVTFTTENSAEFTSERTGGAFASVLVDEFPQVESGCRISQALQFELGIPAEDSTSGAVMRFYYEEMVLAVDSNFFSFYSFPLLEGDPATVFAERNHMVITRELSSKLFGDQDPIGRQVRIGEGSYFTVTGL